MPEGVCEIAKVCYENWVTFVLLFVALGAPSFRCFPKSADIPPRPIMPKQNSFSCSFVFDRCLESLRKLFWGEKCQKGLPIFQKVRYENWGMVFAVCGLRNLSFLFIRNLQKCLSVSRRFTVGIGASARSGGVVASAHDVPHHLPRRVQ